SPHVPPAQARRPLGLRRSLRRAGGAVHGEPPRAPARPGRAGRGERRSLALRLARPRRVPEPPPRFHPPDALRWPSTASTRPHRARLTTASADLQRRGRLESRETKTAAGDLALSGEVERDATVKTVSGDVRIERVGGDLKLTSVSGDATVRSIGGSVEAKTVSGDVRLESVREGRVTLQSVSGDIEVGVETGTNLDVDAGSVSGDLSSEVPLGSD